MTTYRELVKEAVEAWPQFDSEAHVSGADLVEWFEEWRRRAKRELAARGGAARDLARLALLVNLGRENSNARLSQ